MAITMVTAIANGNCLCLRRGLPDIYAHIGLSGSGTRMFIWRLLDCSGIYICIHDSWRQKVWQKQQQKQQKQQKQQQQ